MRANRLREKLKAGKPTVSTHIHTTWPSIVEALGNTGLYDYVEFVAEYAPFDLHDLDNLCRAAELYSMGAMIKVDRSHREFLAQRGIGAGCGSVLFTDSRSAEDVRECVRIVRPDTPEDGGLYGFAARRNTYAGGGASLDYVQALRDVVVAIMVEKKSAVDNLDEILAVPGVDMVQWGGADYSISSGLAGARGGPEVTAARNKVFKTAISRGIPARAEIQSVDQAKEYLDMGVRHFSIGTDISILSGWWRENGGKLWKALEGGS